MAYFPNVLLFSNFSCRFLNSNSFFQFEFQFFKGITSETPPGISLKSNQKLFWPFTVRINWSRDLQIFANSWLSASNLKSFSPSLEQFFLTVCQNNFENKIQFLHHSFSKLWNQVTFSSLSRWKILTLEKMKTGWVLWCSKV